MVFDLLPAAGQLLAPELLDVLGRLGVHAPPDLLRDVDSFRSYKRSSAGSEARSAPEVRERSSRGQGFQAASLIASMAEIDRSVTAFPLPDPPQSPRSSDFVSVQGRWIADCGHDNWLAEIHPPDAVTIARTFVPVASNSLRVSLGYMWVNRFLADGSQSTEFGDSPGNAQQNVFAPPRPSATAKMVVYNHESGYFFSHGLLRTEATTDRGYMVSSVDTTLSSPQIEDSGEMIYPDSTTRAPEYQDLAAIYWEEPDQNILIGGFGF